MAQPDALNGKLASASWSTLKSYGKRNHKRRLARKQAFCEVMKA